MTEAEVRLRELLVSLARRMLGLGLVTGRSGNLSARDVGSHRILVTPSAVAYETMGPDDLVAIGLDGQPVGPGGTPSVDTMNHVAIYRARPDVNAVVHTHSPYATAFSTLPEPIPPLVTEAAGFLGGAVRPIEYLPPARPEFAERLADGLGGDRAVLLPHHGVVAVGETPEKAFAAAVLVEESARVAWIARLLGRPQVVPEAEIERLHEFIHHRYGQR